MKNIILTSFLVISILTSVTLLILKFTGQVDISLFNAVFFAFIPNLSALVTNLLLMFLNRLEVFLNILLDIFMF